MSEDSPSPELLAHALTSFIGMVAFLAHWSEKAERLLAAGNIDGAREVFRGAGTLLDELAALYRESIAV